MLLLYVDPEMMIQVIVALMCTRKIAALRAAFPSSCGGLQPSAATVGPFGPKNRALRAHLKMLKINLENFAGIWLIFFAKFHLEQFVEICLENFEEIHSENVEEIHLQKFCGNPFGKF